MTMAKLGDLEQVWLGDSESQTRMRAGRRYRAIVFVWSFFTLLAFVGFVGSAGLLESSVINGKWDWEIIPVSVSRTHRGDVDGSHDTNLGMGGDPIDLAKVHLSEEKLLCIERYGFYECERMEVSVDFATIKPHENGMGGEKGIAPTEPSMIMEKVEMERMIIPSTSAVSDSQTQGDFSTHSETERGCHGTHTDIPALDGRDPQETDLQEDLPRKVAHERETPKL